MLRRERGGRKRGEREEREREGKGVQRGRREGEKGKRGRKSLLSYFVMQDSVNGQPQGTYVVYRDEDKTW